MYNEQKKSEILKINDFYNNKNNEGIILTMHGSDDKDVLSYAKDVLLKLNKNGIYSACNNFYKKNLDTIKKIGSYDMDDIIQIGNIYFLESIEKFDISKNVKFITFTTNYIYWMLSSKFYKHSKIKSNMRVEYNKKQILEDTPDEETFDAVSDGGYHVPYYNEKYDDKLLIDEIISRIPNIRNRNLIIDYYFNQLSEDELRFKYGFKTNRVVIQTIHYILAKIRRSYNMGGKNG